MERNFAKDINGFVVQTVATLMTFILFMVLHPEVAKKAQAEIDAVVGRDRLPDFEDRESLSYINCILKEILRYVIELIYAFSLRTLILTLFIKMESAGPIG